MPPRSSVSSGELTRYRVMAWTTGVLLLLLVFVAMPLKYLGDDERLVSVVGLNDGSLRPMQIGSDQRLAVVFKEKGSKSRMVPLPKEAEMLLRVYLGHEELQAIARDMEHAVTDAMARTPADPSARLDDQPGAAFEEGTQAQWIHDLLQPIVDREYYSRFYYQLHKNVDQEMMKVYQALKNSRFYEDTIVIFTSDHGDMLWSQNQQRKQRPQQPAQQLALQRRLRRPHAARAPSGSPCRARCGSRSPGARASCGCVRRGRPA